MNSRVLLPILLLSYLIVIFPFTAYMKNKPFIEKMGYVPSAEFMRLVSADQKQSIAAALVMKTMMYYGGLVEQAKNRIAVSVDYPGMFEAFTACVKLDPYNMDAYYFSQAVLVWDAQQVERANDLLIYGMRYRDWDYYLPYFAGFNYAYFLKDYANAAIYYKRAGELLGTDLPINLAGRYMYESGRTDMAISYLTEMIRGAGNDAVKHSLQTRLKAFQSIRTIEQAKEAFRRTSRRDPASVDELLEKGYLKELPVDPYGGTFYIDNQGMVRSTSKFAFGVVKK
jgi:tetratricopeptide (TPR) repeat protein